MEKNKQKRKKYIRGKRKALNDKIENRYASKISRKNKSRKADVKHQNIVDQEGFRP